jgi:hypothetical protein
MYVNFFDYSIAIYKALKPYNLVGFEPTIFCPEGGYNDHATTRAVWLRTNDRKKCFLLET